jgi:hypothetical protein
MVRGVVASVTREKNCSLKKTLSRLGAKGHPRPAPFDFAQGVVSQSNHEAASEGACRARLRQGSGGSAVALAEAESPRGKAPRMYFLRQG